ncbi:hypothetical protein [Gulosibacter faecalis]|jgi:hypothetical protein|uniref:Asp23/Gls24 family envelope stress response protein n=1 Tax=Gulosibacter faecalis TaxID=272240 RepID=A0ABW5V258_9MICO|nr:hypothetical protein [Gulosibacter faecalis]
MTAGEQSQAYDETQAVSTDPSSIDAGELAAEIESAVRAVPGVTIVFRSGSALSKLVEAGAQALGLRDEASLVAVEANDAGVRVTASLGLDAGLSVAETLRRAREVIATLLEARGLREPEIRLTAVYIEH